MLILSLLGYLCLMLIALQGSQNAIAKLFTGWQRKIFASSLDVPFVKSLPRSLLLVLTEASPQRTQWTSLMLYNLRILGKRPSVLLIALSNLGAWWVLVLTILFMNINAAMLIGICVLPILVFRNFDDIRRLFAVVIFGGLFLTLSETVIRHATALPAMLGESEVIFWLADGRASAVLGLLLAAILVTWIVQIEFWSVCVALVLLFASVLSFNGALALFAGERVARALMFTWAGRKLNQDCGLISRYDGIAAACGAVVGLFITLYMREVSDLGRSFGFSNAQSRLLDFAFALTIILFVQLVMQMLSGHFAAQKKVDELQDIKYFPNSWLSHHRLSLAGVAWSRVQIAKRIQEIRYHIQGLTTFKEGQIPDYVQVRLRQEEVELAKLLALP